MKSDRLTGLTLVLVAAVTATTFLVYLPGLSGPLLLDDLPQLNGIIDQSANDPSTLFGNYIISTSGPTGRPVAMATLVANAVAHGPDIRMWKYNNVLFHLISGLLVCWLTGLLLQALPDRTRIDPWMAGAVVAGLWLLHPLHVSTVLYTVQRMTELSTLFVFAGLVCYVKGRLLQDRSISRGWFLIGIGFAVFYPLGVFSKENALVFPVYCSLAEFVVLRFRGAEILQRQLRVFHGVLVAGYLAGAALIIANFSNFVLESYVTRDFTLPERLLTQCRVLATYLSQLVMPLQSRMGFFHDDFPVSTGLLSPVTTLASASLLLALAASAFILWRKLPLYAFGVLFFFASHVIESSILGLELMFEHRNYIGSFGVLVAAMAIALRAAERRREIAVLAAIALFGLSFLTWQRSLTWSAPETLYQYMYAIHPESPRLNVVMANAHASANQFADARRLLDKAGTGPGIALHGLLFDCREYGAVDEAAMQRIALSGRGVIDGHVTSSAELLVQAVIRGQCSVSKHSLDVTLDRILTLRSRTAADRISVLFTKARLLESMNDIDAAQENYLAAQELSNNDALPLYLAADTLIRHGRPGEARVLLRRAIEVEKQARIQRKETAQTIYAGLGMAYEDSHEFDEALALYDEALASMPRRSLFYVRRAELLLRMHRYDEVRETLEEVRDLDLEDRDQHDHSLQQIAATMARIEH